MMNDIISSKTNRLQIGTFSAIQKIKYDLKASNQKSVQKYCHINFLRFPVDQELCSKITSSWKAYEDRLKETWQKRNSIMRKWVLAQSQKIKEFHLTKWQQNLKRNFF